MADINPNINGSTVNPLWIDGGPDNPAPTFNIDDPTMWMPMTVISGLASGFCERAAVITGGTLAANVGWKDLTDTDKAAVVSNCAANIAKGTDPTTIADMYVAADATMGVPVSSTATYMKTMDKMITQLIGDGGYVLATGSTYSDFTALANSASARAEHYTSDIAAIDSNGGALGEVMANAYPAEWAKQRKWMLDELKYASATLITGTSVLASCFHGVGSSTITDGDPGTGYSPATGEENYPYVQVYTSFATTVTTGALKDIKGVGDQAYTYIAHNSEPYMAVFDTLTAGNSYCPYYIVVDVTDEITDNSCMNVFFGVAFTNNMPGYESTEEVFNDGAATVIDATGTVSNIDGTTVFDGYGSSYVITNGATATLSGNYINDLTISSGCKAILALTGADDPPSGYCVARLNIMDGGSCQYVATYAATGNRAPTDAFYNNYVLDDQISYVLGNRSFAYRTGGGTISNVGDTTYRCLLESGQYTLQDKNVTPYLALLSGATVTNVKFDAQGRVVVGDGCVYCHNPTADPNDDYDPADRILAACEVLSGGSAEIKTGSIGTVLVCSGGTLTIKPSAQLTGVEGLTITGNLILYEGATLELPDNTEISKSRLALQWVTGGTVTNDSLFRSVEFLSFNNLGMTKKDFDGSESPITPGWNTARVTGTTIGNKTFAHVCGTSDQAAATAAALSEPVLSRIGVPDNAITVLPAGSATLFNRSDGILPTLVNNGAAVLAIGGGTAIFDYYGSFRVRQFYTNPDITEAAEAAAETQEQPAEE